VKDTNEESLLKGDAAVFHDATDGILVGIRHIFLDVSSPVLSHIEPPQRGAMVDAPA
jgi:hypothetical protein